MQLFVDVLVKQQMESQGSQQEVQAQGTCTSLFERTSTMTMEAWTWTIQVYNQQT